MQQSRSWIGFQGLSKQELLDKLGLEDTGQEGDFLAAASPFSLGQFTGGWLVLFIDDYDWADPKRVLELSRLSLVVGCQFNDKVNLFSAICAARGGTELWRVSQPRNEDTISSLEISGHPPVALGAILSTKAREKFDEEGDGLEFSFEVPLELGKAVCGFRHDEGEAPFVGVKPVPGGWAASACGFNKAETVGHKIKPVFKKTKVTRPFVPIWVGWIIILILLFILTEVY